eukprot:scpid36678/ scgid32819/ 
MFPLRFSANRTPAAPKLGIVGQHSECFHLHPAKNRTRAAPKLGFVSQHSEYFDGITIDGCGFLDSALTGLRKLRNWALVVSTQNVLTALRFMDVNFPLSLYSTSSLPSTLAMFASSSIISSSSAVLSGLLMSSNWGTVKDDMLPPEAAKPPPED